MQNKNGVREGCNIQGCAVWSQDVCLPVEVEVGEGRGGGAETRNGVGSGDPSVRQTQEEVLKVCDLRASALREENVRSGEAAVRQAAVVEEL